MAVWFWFLFRARWAISFVFFQQNPIGGTIVALVLTLITAACAIRRRERDPALPSAWTWAKAYLCLSIASLAWTHAANKAAAAGYLAMTLADVFIMYDLLCRRDRNKILRDSMRGLVFGAWLTGLIAFIWAGLTGSGRLGNDELFHPNMIGYTMALGIFAAVWLVSHGYRVYRWSIIALSWVMLRSFSKTTIAAASFSLAVYFLFFMKYRLRTKITVGIIAAIMCLVLLPLAINYYEDYAMEETGGAERVASISGRTVLWAGLTEMALDHPALGWGFYSVKDNAPDVWDVTPLEAHNELLEQFFTLGAAGLLLSLMMYWKAFSFCYSNRHWFAVFVLVYFVIRGFTEADFLGTGVPIAFLLLLLATAANNDTAFKAAPVAQPASLTGHPTLAGEAD
jgi:hypothetical protein